jgi:hypothetical protein
MLPKTRAVADAASYVAVASALPAGMVVESDGPSSLLQLGNPMNSNDRTTIKMLLPEIRHLLLSLTVSIGHDTVIIPWCVPVCHCTWLAQV